MVDFTSYRSIVDAVGGVDIIVECPFHDTYPDPESPTGQTDIDMEPGLHHLNGKYALWYVRGATIVCAVVILRHRAGAGWTGALVTCSAPMIVSALAAEPFALWAEVAVRQAAALIALQAFAISWLAAVSEVGVAYTTLLPAFVAGGAGMALVFAPSAPFQQLLVSDPGISAEESYNVFVGGVGEGEPVNGRFAAASEIGEATGVVTTASLDEAR